MAKDRTAKDWVITLCKITFFVGAFVLVGLMALMNMGGNSDVFRNSIEDYIGGHTGYDATIEKFNAMTFFPVLGLDFEGLQLRTSPEDRTPAATAARVQVAFGFWDVIRGNGRVRYFSIDDVQAVAGVLGPHSVKLERAWIDEPNDGPAQVRATGRIGRHDLDFRTEMETIGRGRHKDFRFPPDKNFSLALGPVSVAGVLSTSADGVTLRDVNFVRDGKEALRANLVIHETNMRDINITGDMVFAPGGTVIKPDLSLRPRDGALLLEGELSAEEARESDLDGKSAFVGFLDFLDREFGDAKDKGIRVSAAGAADVRLTIKFPRLISRGGGSSALEQEVGAAKADLVVHPGRSLLQTYSLEAAPPRALPPL